jgi:hypothetical protein
MHRLGNNAYTVSVETWRAMSLHATSRIVTVLPSLPRYRFGIVETWRATSPHVPFRNVVADMSRLRRNTANALVAVEIWRRRTPNPEGVALSITPYKRAEGEVQCGVTTLYTLLTPQELPFRQPRNRRWDFRRTPPKIETNTFLEKMIYLCTGFRFVPAGGSGIQRS